MRLSESPPGAQASRRSVTRFFACSRISSSSAEHFLTPKRKGGMAASRTQRSRSPSPARISSRGLMALIPT